MTADLVSQLLYEQREQQFHTSEAICSCRMPDGTYCYHRTCFLQLMNGEGVPCQQVPDSGVRYIREEGFG